MAVKTDLNEKLLQEVFALYVDAEEKMLEKLASRVKRGVTTPGWTESKFSDVKKLREETEALLLDRGALTKKRLSDGILKAYYTGRVSAETDMKAPITAMKDMGIPEHLQRMVLEVNNIIDGTSFQILRNVNDTYRQVIAEASSGVLTGVDTRLQASQDALNRLAAKGITGFVDKAGRQWDLASYIEMATRTTTARAALQGHIDRQLELDNDLIKISSISTTCPVCDPWQGKVLSITGKTPDYPTLEQAKAAGAFHPNCKHTIMAYFPEIDDYSRREVDNNPERYKATQQQRAGERQIRKWKRMEAVAMSPSETAYAQAKIRFWQGKQRALVKAYDLKRNYAREGIRQRMGDASKATTPPAIGKITKPVDGEALAAKMDKVDVYKEHSKEKREAKKAKEAADLLAASKAAQVAKQAAKAPVPTLLSLEDLRSMLAPMPSDVKLPFDMSPISFNDIMSAAMGSGVSGSDMKRMSTKRDFLLSDLHKTKDKASKDVMERFLSESFTSGTSSPLVVKIKDKYVIYEGAAKTALLKMQGHTTVKLDYFDLDEKIAKEVIIKAEAAKIAAEKAKKAAEEAAERAAKAAIEREARKAARLANGAPNLLDLEDIPTLKVFEDHQQKWVLGSRISLDKIEAATEVLKEMTENSVTRSRVPNESILNMILDDGRFKTQMETRSSMGSFNPDGRKRATKAMFGVDPKELTDQDYEVYGYLWADDFADDFNNCGASQYGEVIVQLKPDIRTRTTFTVDDSLGPALNDRMIPTLLEDPRMGFERFESTATSIIGVGKKYPGAVTPKEICKSTHASYVEAQYHGGVSTSDIESVVFSKYTIPKPETIERLKALGAKVGQARGHGDQMRIEWLD